MKTNVRNEDAITSAMGWLDQLREDGYAEPVSGRRRPATARRTGHGRWPARGRDRPAAEHRERQA